MGKYVSCVWCHARSCRYRSLIRSRPSQVRERHKCRNGLVVYLCGTGALLGMISSCYVALYGQARILCVVARDHMLPPVLARIAPASGTPVTAAILMGLITGATPKRYTLKLDQNLNPRLSYYSLVFAAFCRSASTALSLPISSAS